MSHPTDTRELRRVITEALMATPFGESISLTADRVADQIVSQQWLITGGKALPAVEVYREGHEGESVAYKVYTEPDE